jgi:hypothetical protein
MACMNNRTKVKIYIITTKEYDFYIADADIIWIESPIIKDTKVVTDFDNVQKNLTFGNKHRPSNVYAKNTGKNYIKKKIILMKLNLTN